MDRISEAKEFLKKIVAINSVESAPVDGAPFGRGVAECLILTLDEMAKHGFRTVDGEGYYGYGEIGEGELFGVLTHLDVVPVGEGWSHDPFGAETEDGKIFGRGTMDDKGPFCAAFFAAVKLLDDGYKPTKRLRFIVGCDEESGWKCMDRYAEREEMPQKGFSPDGDFPVINSEKGIVYHTVKIPLPSDVISLTAGERANMVPASAKILFTKNGSLIDRLDKAKIPYTNEGKRIAVSEKGKASHGSHPEQGENALVKLFRTLSPAFEGFKLLYDAFASFDGSGIGLKVFDEKSGALTVNPGCVVTEGRTAVLSVDVRYPHCISKEDVTVALKKTLPYEVEEVFYHLPLYVPEENELVQKLLFAYEKVTGEKARPVAIGGGTYARVLPLGVAFGPCFPGGNNGMHCADEYISTEDFEKMFAIYYEALKELCFAK